MQQEALPLPQCTNGGTARSLKLCWHQGRRLLAGYLLLIVDRRGLLVHQRIPHLQAAAVCLS